MEYSKRHIEKRKEAIIDTIGLDPDRTKGEYIIVVEEDLNRIFDEGFDEGRVYQFSSYCYISDFSLIITIAIFFSALVTAVYFFTQM